MSEFIETLVKGEKPTKEQITNELYSICENTHAKCNDACPVFRLNGSKVPDTAKDFKVNRGCDCFKDGTAMYDFIQHKQNDNELEEDYKKEISKSELKIVKEKTIRIKGKKNILMIDPCYIFDHTIPTLDKAWQEFCTLMSTTEDGFTNGILKYNGATMLYGGTAYGDGSYRVTSRNIKQCGKVCGVDAGMLCFITMEDALKINPKFEAWDSGVVFKDFAGKLETDGEGLFKGSNGIECNTK